MRASTLILLGCVALPACTVGPAFQAPKPEAPPEWSALGLDAVAGKEGAVSEAGIVDQWWKQFDDVLLVELVERANQSNLDVQAAVLRVAQSRAQRNAVAGGRWPAVSASASYQRERLSEFGEGTRLVQAIAPPGERDAIISVLSEPHDVYQAGFDASWELDLWGRVQRTLESADASVAASAEELRSARLSLAAETARTYIELRGVQDQLHIARNDVTAAESLLELTEHLASGGLVTQLDVVSQRARLADTRAGVPQLQQREAQLINALALLVGLQPGALQAQLASAGPVPAPPSRAALGVPSEIARRRPDIRAAEARLHAATAEIGVATADLYPRFTLTGGFLFQSLDVAHFTDWGARQWTVGPSLSLPVFNGGQLRSVVELRELQQQETAVNYQRTVLQAWHEIDNALTAYLAEQKRNDELAVSVEASREAYEIASVRYEHGLTTFLVALDAQRTLLQAERAYSDSTTTISTNLVALYKALGGGW